MQWHDLLGAVLIDFFDGSPYVVETEVDLSLKKQYLDIVVIRKKEGDFQRALPDGFSPLSNHNLISFKSHQDTFDGWSVLEFIGHYVNYRKQTSPSLDQLLAEEQFRLFGITARFPESLAKQVRLEEIQTGVYDINVGPLRIRLLVIRDLPNEPANAMFKLFSVAPDQIEFACRHYRPSSPRTTGIVDKLISKYRMEDARMATTVEELNRKLMKEAMEMASVKDRLKGLTTQERLKGLSAEEIEAYLRGLKKKKPRGKSS
jgi:hypothetical protein